MAPAGHDVAQNGEVAVVDVGAVKLNDVAQLLKGLGFRVRVHGLQTVGAVKLNGVTKLLKG